MWRRRLSVARVLGALCVLTGAMAVTAGSAHGSTEGLSEADVCAGERMALKIGEELTKLLSPAEGATVPVGTAVTFSGKAGVASPLRFMIASSPALLSSPDIDSGPGAQQPSDVNTFTSTKAGAKPGTIYWAASFTRVLADCKEPPVTFTTPARSLVVASTNEEAPLTQGAQESGGSVTLPIPDARLANTSLSASSSGALAVKVRCPVGESICAGTITLRTLNAVSTRHSGPAHGKATILTLATGSFTVAGGMTTRVVLHLTAKARTLFAHVTVLRARATIIAHDWAGARDSSEAIVTIRVPRTKRH